MSTAETPPGVAEPAPHPAERAARILVAIGSAAHCIGAEVLKTRNTRLAHQLAVAEEEITFLAEHRAEAMTDAYHLGRLDERRGVQTPVDVAAVVDAHKHARRPDVEETAPPRVQSTDVDIRSSAAAVADAPPRPDPDYGFIPKWSDHGEPATAVQDFTADPQ